MTAPISAAIGALTAFTYGDAPRGVRMLADLDHGDLLVAAAALSHIAAGLLNERDAISPLPPGVLRSEILTGLGARHADPSP